MIKRIQKGLIGIVSAGSILAFASSADAACKKPIGRYVGSGSGLAGSVDPSSWTPTEAGNIALSINIMSDGTVYALEKGKLLTKWTYQTNWSVAPGNNIFSMTTCQGRIITSTGARFTYTSSRSGKVITFVYTKNDNTVVLYNIRLEKV